MLYLWHEKIQVFKNMAVQFQVLQTLKIRF